MCPSAAKMKEQVVKAVRRAVGLLNEDSETAIKRFCEEALGTMELPNSACAKVEILEEDDDTKVVREIMEEPNDTVRMRVTLPAPISYICLTVTVKEEP